MAVLFDPKHEANDFGTSTSVFSSVELEIRAIISFEGISWYEVTLLLRTTVPLVSQIRNSFRF